ncbi:hypothetical protein [Streptomyces syringium]
MARARSTAQRRLPVLAVTAALVATTALVPAASAAGPAGVGRAHL